MNSKKILENNISNIRKFLFSLVKTNSVLTLRVVYFWYLNLICRKVVLSVRSDCEGHVYSWLMETFTLENIKDNSKKR